MKKVQLVIAILLCSIISCKEGDDKLLRTVPKHNAENKNGIEFEKYIKKFRNLELNKINNISNLFYKSVEDEYSNKLELVPTKYLKKYLNELDISSAYYGYKIKLNDKAIMLVYLTHSVKNEINLKTELDTTYFKGCIYDLDGEFKSNINLIGSNIGASDPTYNLYSEIYKDKINTHEYFYNMNQESNNLSDSVVSGFYLTKQFVLDSKTAKFNQRKNERKKAKMTLELSNDSAGSAIIKLLD